MADKQMLFHKCIALIKQLEGVPTVDVIGWSSPVTDLSKPFPNIFLASSFQKVLLNKPPGRQVSLASADCVTSSPWILIFIQYGVHNLSLQNNN